MHSPQPPGPVTQLVGRRTAIRRLPLVIVQATGRRFGVDIRHYRPVGRRRMALLRRHSISTVLDVGANRGQYASEIRRWGYTGRIESFEPIPAEFRELRRLAAPDPQWTCHQLALGDYDGQAELNVAASAPSSSFRQAVPGGEPKHSASIAYTLSVPIGRLDAIGLALPPGGTMLKMDVQGYEDAVLRGAEATLARVALIECELSIRPLYGDQPLLLDMVACLHTHGFRLTALNPGYQDVATGEILQFDGMFERVG